MKITSRREWLALTSASLFGSACGGGGGDNAPATSVTAVTLSGPTSGIVNGTSTNFTVGANGPVGADIVVTPSSGSGGGTFTPTTVTLTTGAPTATFTYTPTTTGAKTIRVTNNQGLTNPASIVYTATTVSATNPTFTNLRSGLGTNNTSSTTTPSVTLAANRLALLTIISAFNNGNTPTCAGWTQVATVQLGSIARMTVLRRMVTSDLTLAHTYDFGGQAQYFNRWSIDQSSANVNTTGTNGSGAIVQAVTNGELGRGGTVGTYVSVALAAFGNANNSTFAAFGGSVGMATPTAGAGFTELARPGTGTGEYAMIVEYKAANDTVADASWSNLYDVWTGVAVEVAAG